MRILDLLNPGCQGALVFFQIELGKFWALGRLLHLAILTDDPVPNRQDLTILAKWVGIFLSKAFFSLCNHGVAPKHVHWDILERLSPAGSRVAVGCDQVLDQLYLLLAELERDAPGSIQLELIQRFSGLVIEPALDVQMKLDLGVRNSPASHYAIGNTPAIARNVLKLAKQPGPEPFLPEEPLCYLNAVFRPLRHVLRGDDATEVTKEINPSSPFKSFR